LTYGPSGQVPGGCGLCEKREGLSKNQAILVQG
jgi:hypothetical protein